MNERVMGKVEKTRV